MAFRRLPGVTPQVLQVLNQECYTGPFNIRERCRSSGPKIGADLRHQAVLVVLYALAAMLVYIAFRFEWIYGVAAVIAVFHDTIITIGLFSIFNKPIDLTVLAALLTLVGYSMNDTIVVFDRIRENLNLGRRGSFERSCEPQHQSDLKPDHSYVGADLSDGDFAVSVRRAGIKRVLVRAGNRHYCRYLLLDFYSESDFDFLERLCRPAKRGPDGDRRRHPGRNVKVAR